MVFLTQETPEEKKNRRRQEVRDRVRQPKQRRQVVDKDGNPQKLTNYQKSMLLRRAKMLKRRIEKAMVSYDQCWKPTEHNVELLRKREHGVDHLKREYRKIMEAIGASDSDLGLEKFRRRKK